MVVKASDTLGTKLQELPPGVKADIDRLAAKVPALGCLHPHPYIRRMARAAAEAERRALEDRVIRETLAKYGLTPESHRMSILTALWSESIVSAERARELFEFTLEDGS